MHTSIVETRPSRTALLTAFMRAMTEREKNPRIQRVDPLAVQFLTPSLRYTLRLVPHWLLKRLVALQSPGGYQFIVSRSVHVDRAFLDALKAGYQQIVLLGAGYDSRAYRYARLAEHVRIFEVDSPHTQSRKRRILSAARARVQNVAYVPLDLMRSNLRAALAEAGYDPSKRTLFVWEGVTLYLTPAAVDGTLEFIRTESGAGSSVIFDYLYGCVLRGESDHYGAMASYHGAWQKGERWVFGIEEGQIERFLETRGFRVVAHCTPTDLAARFEADAMLACLAIVTASVAPCSLS